MRKQNIIISLFVAASLSCAQTPAPSSGAGSSSASLDRVPEYTPPTNSEKFHAYLHRTFSVATVFEAGVHAGVDQARSAPSQWPEGAQGYAERFGSAAGGIVVRGTTELGMAALFREDLRRQPRGNRSVFTAALADTFTARKGDDGHTAFSFARLLGPPVGGLVESSWKPDGFGKRSAVRAVGLNYGLVFGRNLLKELFGH